MINETIKRWEIEDLREMSTEDLVKILQLYTSYRIECLFVECVRYEIESRYRAETRLGTANRA